jgi:hypothetical protein
VVAVGLARLCQTRAERASEKRDPHYSRSVGVPRFAA